MNKKLLTILGVATMALSTGCQFLGGNTSTNSTPATDNNDVVLADAESAAWVVHGNNMVGDVSNGWDDKDASVFEATSMTAISINGAKEINAEVGAALDAKNVKYLYTIDVTLGTNDAGWTTKVMREGKKYEVNGSYAFKAGKVAKADVEVENEDGTTSTKTVYSTTQWISDPHTAHAEALTPDTVFVPTWTEAKDENGFSWGDNPAAIGGAGVYTLIVAQYEEVSAADVAGYGFALVKKEAKDAATEDVEVVSYKADEHTYGLVGSFASSGWADGKDTAMTGENGTYTGELTLNAGEEVKVRADGAWSYNWGAAAVKSAPEGAFDLSGDNIKCSVAGTYVFTISNFTESGSAEITITAK